MTGRELKKIRIIDLGLSQWELAERLNSYQVHISRLEADETAEIPEVMESRVKRLVEESSHDISV